MSRFETTQWSLVVAAGGADTTAARDALGALCETYWYPIYAYMRRRGQSPDDARDLTQAFLASLIERQDFEGLDRERGRFRAFLLASLQHFLANDHARQRAKKRGAGQVPLSLEGSETRYSHEPPAPMTPETIFDRRWALTVIDRVFQDLRATWTEAGRVPAFDALKASLVGEGPKGGYAAIAASLGTTEGAVKTAAHRLRRDFKHVLRRHIRETVVTDADVEEEIRYLIRAVTL